METKGIIISQKDYERLIDIEKNFDTKIEELRLREKAKRFKDHEAAFGLYQEVISNQKKGIRNLWWAFGIMFVDWLTMLIAYIF